MDWKKLLNELRKNVEIGKEFKIVVGLVILIIVSGVLLTTTLPEPEATIPENVTQPPLPEGMQGSATMSLQGFDTTELQKPLSGKVRIDFNYESANVTIKLTKNNQTFLERTVQKSVEIDFGESESTQTYPFKNYAYPNGAYDLTITAKNQTSTIEERTINIIIKHPDTTTPLISLTNVRNGQTISGNQEIRVQARDDQALRDVKWCRGYECVYEDGWQEMSYEGGSEFTAAWNTLELTNGEYMLKFRATDAEGNKADAKIFLKVNN